MTKHTRHPERSEEFKKNRTRFFGRKLPQNDMRKSHPEAQAEGLHQKHICHPEAQAEGSKK